VRTGPGQLRFHLNIALLFVPLLLGAFSSSAATLTNRAERLEWFRDQGFGLFIHWSVDSQLGVVISHSLVGASDDYAGRFFTNLPKTFNPRKFHPQDWAALARLAGVRYVVFTAKHHSGFCMWPTATTDFNIEHTPFNRDVTGEVLNAFREQGIAPGLYFSPDDFLWLYRNGKDIQRRVGNVDPPENPGLMDLDLAQVRELMTKYGSVDVVFFDGVAEKLRDLAWELQPNTVVTRGAIQTPEKTIPGQAMDVPWESCITMGDGWQYQPTLENYKSAGQLIRMLIETRAKGGNLLLNVGPKPDGELPLEQEERLREIAQWMFVNSEAIYAVRPWVVTNEKETWFTKRKDTNTVYAFVTPGQRWKMGETADVTFTSMRATAQTEISVLGQNDRVLEYQTVVPKTTWRQASDGLHVHFTQAQRLRDNRTWPNPVVLKITHAEAVALQVRVETMSGRWNSESQTAELRGKLLDLGNSGEVEAGFEFRDITGEDANERTRLWQQSARQTRSITGEFSQTISNLGAGRSFEFRAVVKSPSVAASGQEVRFQTRSEP
jgi:alpha-L-fucosidase